MQKILYVEDDLSLIDGLQYTLEASGYMVDNGQNRITKRSPFRVRMIFLLIAMHYGCRRRLEISSKMLWNTHNRAVTFRCNGHNHPC